MINSHSATSPSATSTPNTVTITIIKVMKTSPRGRAFIEAFEGRCNYAYDDGTGVWTIGYGHTSAAGPPKVFNGQWIDDRECDAILSHDLEKVEAVVNDTLPRLQQYQFDAMVSFEFNTGCLRKSSIPAKLKAGNVAAAMATLLQYDHAGGKQLAGLTRRRQAEKLMFGGNVEPALRMARGPVTPTPKVAQPPGPLAMILSFFTKRRA